MKRNAPKRGRKRERVAAIDLADRKTIIAIGTDAKKVVEKARKSGKKFIMAWVPIPGRKYIFAAG